MIYKILGSDVKLVFERNGRLIVLGGNGVHALVTDLSNTDNITIVEQYNNSQLNELLAESEWQQPCVNC
jgi:hypothetical protein